MAKAREMEATLQQLERQVAELEQRLMDQTIGRYNNESADNLSAARANFVVQQQANWMALLDKVSSHTMLHFEKK